MASSDTADWRNIHLICSTFDMAIEEFVYCRQIVNVRSPSELTARNMSDIRGHGYAW